MAPKVVANTGEIRVNAHGEGVFVGRGEKAVSSAPGKSSQERDAHVLPHHRAKRKRVQRGDSFADLQDQLLKTEDGGSLDREVLAEPLDRQFLQDIKQMRPKIAYYKNQFGDKLWMLSQIEKNSMDTEARKIFSFTNHKYVVCERLFRCFNFGFFLPLGRREKRRGILQTSTAGGSRGGKSAMTPHNTSHQQSHLQPPGTTTPMASRNSSAKKVQLQRSDVKFSSEAKKKSSFSKDP